MVLQHRAKAEQEKAKLEQQYAKLEQQYAAEIHRQACELADDAKDYTAAIQLIEVLDPKWRDLQLYFRIVAQRDQELAAQAIQDATHVHQQAKQLAEQTHDFVIAAQMIETLDPRWRDAKLYDKICGYRDQVAQFDARIQSDVQKGRLRFLREDVWELLQLQPQREDMRRLLDALPEESELGKELTNSIGMRFILIQPGKFTMGSTESRRVSE